MRFVQTLFSKFRLMKRAHFKSTRTIWISTATASKAIIIIKFNLDNGVLNVKKKISVENTRTFSREYEKISVSSEEIYCNLPLRFFVFETKCIVRNQELCEIVILHLFNSQEQCWYDMKDILSRDRNAF